MREGVKNIFYEVMSTREASTTITGELELKEIDFFVPPSTTAEKYVVVKGALPKSIKLRFKVLCVQKDLEMSAVLGELIEKWLQADGPVHESSIDFCDQDFEEVKAYIPKSLKLHFKTLCTQKEVKMRSILYKLINEWVQAQ